VVIGNSRTFRPLPNGGFALSGATASRHGLLQRGRQTCCALLICISRRLRVEVSHQQEAGAGCGKRAEDSLTNPNSSVLTFARASGRQSKYQSKRCRRRP
jgi:hypothetical protein